MNAIVGVLRATFRLKGTLLFWCFYALLFVLAALILLHASEGKGAYVAVSALSFSSWLGWFIFFPRLWQLQRHAEAAQLPAARATHERCIALLCLLGTALPACLLSALGADPLWAWLAPLLSMAVALLYLMVSAATGIGLIVAFSLLPLMSKRFPALDLVTGEYSIALFLLLAIAMLGYCAFRWRALMQVSADSGWNIPQIIKLSERADLAIGDERNDPARHWMSSGTSLIGERLGPNTPIRSLAILLCGSLAPLGWRNYLRNAAWMSVAVMLLTLLSMSEEPGTRGPGFGLLILLSIWALAIPATLITRLRQEWSGSGHALAEAFLLPGMVNPRLSWLQVIQAVLYTSVYRLSLPAVLVFAALGYTTDSLQAGLQTVLVSAWALLLSLSLLPLAQRQGALASFLLYALLGLIVVGLIGTHLIIAQQGPWPIPMLLPIVSAVVLFAAALGGLLPRSQSPFALA